MIALVVATFLTVLGGTILIPAVRPFFAFAHPESEGAIYAFMSVNMLGGALFAPLVAYLADRMRKRRTLALCLLLTDAALMVLSAIVPPLWLALALRTVQGAASVGALSIVMGALAQIAPRRLPVKPGLAPGETYPGALVRKTESRVHGGSLGLGSAAVVAAIAVGAPLGAVCVKIGPRAALFASALLSLSAFVLVFFAMREPDTVAAKREKLKLSDWRDVQVAAIFVAIERFGVGSFVVAFSLYAHAALQKTDAQIGVLYSIFLIPFAACSVLAPMLLRHIPRMLLLLGGGLVYGGAIALFGQTSGVSLQIVLLVAGIASSIIYAPALCIAAAAVPPELRATAMGFTNAAGTLGMMAGTALGGTTAALLMQEGMERIETYRTVFLGAGALVALAFLVTSAVSWSHSPPSQS